eukprot:gene8625-9505_t
MRISEALVQEFGRRVKILKKRDSRTTGNFEVSIVDRSTSNKVLIHSKTTRGQGKCQTPAERQAVIDQVKEYLDGK